MSLEGRGQGKGPARKFSVAEEQTLQAGQGLFALLSSVLSLPGLAGIWGGSATVSLRPVSASAITFAALCSRAALPTHL